jgi:hypothetical protein
MHRSYEEMICIGNFNKFFYISVVSIAKLKNIDDFAFTYVFESFALFYDDSMCIYIVLTVMK